MLDNFNDWVLQRESDDNWITVAESTEYKEKCPLDSSNYMISVISKNINHEKLFNDSEWNINTKFGCPEIWSEQGKIKYNPNYEDENNEITYNPFIIHRYWYTSYTKTKYELIQDFILFYNLYYDDNKFITFKNSGEAVTVVKFIENDKDYKIQIATNFLRNYLAFKNSILIRFHDRRLRSIELIDNNSIIDKENMIKNDNYIFTTSAHKSNHTKNYNSSFWLRGKDIILPYNDKKNLLANDDKYQSFIIDVNDNGEEIEHSCENIFREQTITSVQYLIPIFFKKNVLKRYYDESKKYSIESGLLLCGGYWSIKFDENPSGLIQVYLGDLGGIPYTEQQHWKFYNVKPEGGISVSRYKRDVESEFVDPEEPMYHFRKSFIELQDSFYEKYKFKLFRSLNEDDKYINNSLRIPLNNEIGEFDQQILYLSKFLIDSINVGKLCQYVHKSDKSLGSIKTLKQFLNFKKLNPEICVILSMIQNIRSSGAAHTRGKKYNSFVIKYGLDNGCYQDFFRQQIIDLTKYMKKINSDINS